MKRRLFAISCAALIFTGCKEHGTLIDFGTNSTSQTSSVVSPVPSPDPHQVLVEEFTGQSCPNCPQAHAAIDAISAQNPGRVNLISLYPLSSPKPFPQCVPPTGAQYDFEEITAENVLDGIFGNPGGLPASGADRVSYNGSVLQLGPNGSDGIITTQLAVASPVNIIVTSNYDLAKNVAIINATVTYTEASSTSQNLSIVVVEDNISDLQEFPGVIQKYVFMDVYRGMVTAVPAGDVLQVTKNSNAKEAGRCFKKTYAYALPAKSPAIVPSNCRIIAFVSNADGADKRVLQSAQCKLMN